MSELSWNAQTDEVLTVNDLEAVIHQEEEAVDEYFLDVVIGSEDEEEIFAA